MALSAHQNREVFAVSMSTLVAFLRLREDEQTKPVTQGRLASILEEVGEYIMALDRAQQDINEGDLK